MKALQILDLADTSTLAYFPRAFFMLVVSQQSMSQLQKDALFSTGENVYIYYSFLELQGAQIWQNLAILATF
jgi:hypothetical protein